MQDNFIADTLIRLTRLGRTSTGRASEAFLNLCRKRLNVRGNALEMASGERMQADLGRELLPLTGRIFRGADDIFREKKGDGPAVRLRPIARRGPLEGRREIAFRLRRLA